MTVRVTITRHNVDDLENIAHLLLEDVGLKSFSTNEAYACGIVERQEDNIILTPAQRRQAMQTLTDLVARYNGRLARRRGLWPGRENLCALRPRWRGARPASPDAERSAAAVGCGPSWLCCTMGPSYPATI